MRMNENIKRLVVHFCFINLLNRILNLLLVFGEKLSYKFSSLLKLLLLGKQLKINLLHWYKFYYIYLVQNINRVLEEF